MIKNLFIIGNGFDLNHGIPSRYTNFSDYLYKYDCECLNAIEKYLNIEGDEEFWNNFEVNLANLDEDYLVDDKSPYLNPYDDDGWSDSYHYNFQYEIKNVIELLSEKLLLNFEKWLHQIEIPNKDEILLVDCIDKKDNFISFNYTSTLEVLYDVPKDNILYIHGNINCPSDKIILGHGWERKPEEMLSFTINQDEDARILEAYEQIDSYFSETFKPTKKIILIHNDFFQNLSKTSKIWVLGHSLSDVDIPYFEEIIKHIPHDTQWNISYYKDMSLIKKQFSKLNIPEKFVDFLPLNEL